MRYKTVLFLCVLVATLSVPFFTSISFADTYEHDEITKAIKENDARWSAKETSISKLEAEERRRWLEPQTSVLTGYERFMPAPSVTLPNRLDWRSYNGGSYVTPVKDQGLCASGWAFAVAAALESNALLAQNTPGAFLDVSEQALIACSGAGGCYGGRLKAASDFLQSVGLPTESCYSYTATDGFCSDACSGWLGNSFKISAWCIVSPTVQSVKYALYNFGPVVALLPIRTDYLFYGSGIYSPVWGDDEGYHAMLIVGYDDAEEYFIVKNSWGSGWGEDGYARIFYGGIQAAASILTYQSAISEDFPILDGISRNLVSNAKGQGGDPAPLSVLEGSVKDGAGGALAGVEVKTGKHSAATDRTGRYLFPSIAAGDWVVTAIKRGYSTAGVNVTLKGGVRTTKDFVLTKAAAAKTAVPSGEEAVKEGTENEERETADSGSYKIAGPGWIFGKAPAVSPWEADAYFARRRNELPVMVSVRPSPGREKVRASASSLDIGGFIRTNQSMDGLPMDGAAATITGEIAELARALAYDPHRIYNYVHMFVDYVPYFGSTKGANLTYVDKNGNDFDQASLMIALLRASGYTAVYVYGTMTIPEAEVANWLDAGNLDGADAFLSYGDIPHTVSYEDRTVTLNRVWVRATIDNTDYVFDPAFKSYYYSGRIDVGQATGYSQSEFMAAATAGATVGSEHVQNVNEPNVRSMLTQYSSNLINYLSNYPNHDVMELFGGRTIQEDYTSEYRTGLPFSTSVTATWDDIPAGYATTMRIQIPLYIEWSMRTDEFGGIAWVLSTKGWGVPTSAAMNMTITLDHPYAADNGTYGDQSATYTIHGGRLYNIPYSFGRGVSDMRVQVQKENLDKKLASGSSTQDELIVETLSVMGLVYMKEFSTASKRFNALFDRTEINHHSVGLIAQEDSYYIDLKHIYSSPVSFGGGMTQRELHRSDNNTLAVFMSAFEHTVLEQTMGSDKPGVSTIKLLQIANATGRKVFRAISSNYATIKPQLQNYSSADLNDFQTKVNNGQVLILPDNGQLSLNKWKGKGYVETQYSDDTQTRRVSMVIGGGLFGGYGSYYGNVDPNFYQRYYSSVEDINRSATYEISTAQDPVDMARGAFMTEGTDLTLGGNAPSGLSMARSYDTDKKYSKGTLGYGWTHNNDISLKLSSYAEPVLGDRQPVDTASFVTAMYIIRDIMKTYDDTACAWLVSALAGKWAADQMVDNAVTVNLSNKGFEYIKLPDETYAAPPGVTTKLVKNTDGTFSLQERFGTSMNFNADKKISELKDADGNTISFAYNADKNLASVKDAVGRSLTFSYSNGRIATVSDSAGRTVTYSYDSKDNLTGHTDPEGNTWSYVYDADHRITTLKNPLNITTATNTYDLLGRVNSQSSPRQGGVNVAYPLFFSGYWNMEAAPVPGESDSYYLTTFHYDDKKREWAHLDTTGFWRTKTYDGQDHVVWATDALLSGRNKGTGYTYDANHNLLRTTDALGYSVNNAYDDRFRRIGTTDPQGNRTSFTYDDRHHLLQARDPLGNTITATYLSSGLKGTATDGRGTATAMTYDAYYNPWTTKTGDHPELTYTYDSIGRLTSLTDQEGATTTFTYDKRSLLLRKTDPLGWTTTFTYDAAGRLTSRTDRNNNAITYAYTPLGKVERITYRGTTLPDPTSVGFTYNILDNLISMHDSTGTTRYTYDAVNRITSQADPRGFLVQYTYDPAGNLTALTYPGDRKVIYTYDDLYRLQTVRIDWLNQEASYAYDEAGRLISLTNFNGTVTDYGYDNAGRLTSMDNTKSDNSTISAYRLTLDGNGNRTRVEQNEPLLALLETKETAYTYNDKKNRLLTAGNNAFGYDDEGQLNSGYGRGYSFDYEHRLTSIGGDTQFTYDGKGTRVQATRGGVITNYIYDTRGNLLAEADKDSNILRYYIHGRDLLAVATDTPGQAYCYHYNVTGSTIAMTDQTQTVVNQYSYDPHGNLLGRQEQIPQPFQYVGQFGVMTEPNGFYYMRARYYDPRVGRFISEDPIGFEGGDVNLYAYVGNNPVKRVDPSGLFFDGMFPGASDPGGFAPMWKAFQEARRRNDAEISRRLQNLYKTAHDIVIIASAGEATGLLLAPLFAGGAATVAAGPFAGLAVGLVTTAVTVPLAILHIMHIKECIHTFKQGGK
jgi:RHS repeat-associated protein